MKLQISIGYRTAWGESLVLCAGGKRYPLAYSADGEWGGVIDRFDPDKTPEYGYEVVRDGVTVRKEWKRHRLALPENAAPDMLTVRDRWIDLPYNAPLWSSAFTSAIFGRHQKKARAGKKAGKVSPNVTIRTAAPDIRPGEVLAVAGSGRAMGDWKKVIPMDDSFFPEWILHLEVPEPFEYKFLIADAKTLAPLVWEDGDNRIFTEVPHNGGHLIAADLLVRFRGRAWKGAGTAIPVFSLRSEDDFGVGEFYDLKKMVDWAAATGQCVLQLLPINDTTMSGTWEDSYPYNPNSTFALHPQFINLPAAGVEADGHYRTLQAELNSLGQIDYERVNNAKLALLRKAFDKTFGKLSAKKEYKDFVGRNLSWLMPYAAFCVLRDQTGTPDFTRWGKYAKYGSRKIAAFCKEYQKDIDFWCFVQYHLDRQLSEVCSYAHSKGVIFKGDLPIGISRTSVDAWLYPELFNMDSQAGAPPDAFSEFGQNWGFPTYNWKRMAEDGFAWWKARLKKMAEYFDAFRIDHILGFFRIWEIPADAVHGLLGHFNPALPYSAAELASMGFDVSGGQWVTPPLSDDVLSGIFGDLASEARELFTCDGHIRPCYDTQRKVADKLSGTDEKTVRLREGMMTLLDDVLFVEDPREKNCWHPRISASSTFSFRSLDPWRRSAFERLYDDFFYRRHNDFWRASAMDKLPELLGATGMLACGEDLGMIPACVPDVMDAMRILSLEIQRMPKSMNDRFADPARYPYLSVCTTSTHDMNPLRAWWEEDRGLTSAFWHEVLGQGGDAPSVCETWICRRILGQHLESPAMFTILPLQDWLSMDGKLRSGDAAGERINVPANSRHYWRYRMHLTLEDLASGSEFNEAVLGMIETSGRK